MKEDLKILSERIVLAGEVTDRLEREYDVRVQSFRCADGCVYINLISGIEKLANLYGIKSIMIEDGIVRAETEDVSFYQYVMPDKRNEVFKALQLL